MQIVQHELFPDDTGVSKELLHDLLSEGASCPVRLTITTNRVSMASVSFKPDGSAQVRLHESFLKAPKEVVEALAAYIRDKGKEDWGIVAGYARSIVSGRKRPARRVKGDSAGKVYDLKDIRDEVNKTFFNGRVSCGIEWARARPATRKKRSRSIRFGSWAADESTVKINPLLDDTRVPYEFVRYIVFHEMLHAVVPMMNHKGRRYYHPPAFKSLERSFPDIERMHRLAKELVEVLV